MKNPLALLRRTTRPPSTAYSRVKAKRTSMDLKELFSKQVRNITLTGRVKINQDSSRVPNQEVEPIHITMLNLQSM